jgi:hypothetical protein
MTWLGHWLGHLMEDNSWTRKASAASGHDHAMSNQSIAPPAAALAPSKAEPGMSASTWLGFLAPEDVVRWLAPTDLISQFATGFSAESDDEAAFPMVNRLALEAFRARNMTLASRICQMEIEYAMARHRADKSNRIMLFGLQPVINLVRLNGYTGSLSDALAGLAELERVASGFPARIHGLDITAALLDDSLVAPRLRALARITCLVETAKILWRRGHVERMATASRRLTLKWPRSLDTGPYHAAEAGWLQDADDCARTTGLPRGPTLRRICSLHLLAQASHRPANAIVDLGRELFITRAVACRDKPSVAAARDLASLGDSLIRIGCSPHGQICLGEAHQMAVCDDPSLANSIRERWMNYVGPSQVPAERPCPRLSASDLAAACELAATRFVS